MTKHSISASLILVLALMGIMQSCKSHGNVVRADDYDAETIVDLMNEEEPVINPHKGHSQGKKNSTKKHAAHSPIDGEWTIIASHGKVISTDAEMPYIVFQPDEGRFYASNGCNILNGNYKYSDNTLTFSDVISSLKSCPDNGYIKNINSALADGSHVKTKIENKGRETYLYLSSSSDSQLLTLRKHNLEIINGLWQVTDIDGDDIDNDEINLFFDIPEHTVHGNTGCNFFNGTITIDPEVASSISFSQMGVTMRYCDNAETESKFLVALEETYTYELKGHDTLCFMTSRGKHLMTLKRVEE